MFLRSFLVLIIAASSFLSAGCDQLPSSGHGVTSEPLLLVDFGSLLRATNMDTKVQDELKVAGQRLESQLKQAANDLKQAANDLNQQLKDAQHKAGSKPSLKEQKKLNLLTTKARQRMNELRQHARTKLLQLQADMVKQLRDQVKPIAETIAHQRGAKAVLLVGETTLWFDPGADITADVIAKVRQHPLTLKPLNPVVSAKPDAAKGKGDTKTTK